MLFSGVDGEWRNSFSERAASTVKKKKTGYSQSPSFGPHKTMSSSLLSILSFSSELTLFLFTSFYVLVSQTDCSTATEIEFSEERSIAIQPKSQTLKNIGTSKNQYTNHLITFSCPDLIMIGHSSSLVSRIFVATWNVGGKCPPSHLSLDDWLQASPPADIYVLG